jgi:hypothetical protein
LKQKNFHSTSTIFWRQPSFQFKKNINLFLFFSFHSEVKQMSNIWKTKKKNVLFNQQQKTLSLNLNSSIKEPIFLTSFFPEKKKIHHSIDLKANMVERGLNHQSFFKYTNKGFAHKLVPNKTIFFLYSIQSKFQLLPFYLSIQFLQLMSDKSPTHL